MLTWTDDDRFTLDETTFRTLPPGGSHAGELPAMEDRPDFVVAKPRRLVEHYVELIETLRPRRIFELGMFQGGSTALLAALARPERLVAIDLRLPRRRNVPEYASSKGLHDVVSTFGDVDQADRPRLAEIVEGAFGDHPLDLVVDDCSHRYEATRASFNELFPRLRPGGVYLIEDWRWAHYRVDRERIEERYVDEIPLTRLVLELVLALAAAPSLIAELTVERHFVELRRGEAPVDPRSFDLEECPDSRGRALLGPLPSASGSLPKT